jgi:hypothetical protein
MMDSRTQKLSKDTGSLSQKRKRPLNQWAQKIARNIQVRWTKITNESVAWKGRTVICPIEFNRSKWSGQPKSQERKRKD